MNKSLSLIILTIAILFLFATDIHLQANIFSKESPSRLSVGPTFGYNIVGHKFSIPTYFNDETCSCLFNSAEGSGLNAGISFGYLLGDVNTTRYSLVFRLSYNDFSATAKKKEDPYPIIDINGQTLVSISESTLGIDYKALSIDVMFQFKPIKQIGLGLIIGPSCDYLIAKNIISDLNLIKPVNAKFSEKSIEHIPGAKLKNNNSTIEFYNGDIEDASSLRFGLKVGVQYDLIISNSIYIVPYFAYNYGITKVTSKYLQFS